ncbi:molybdopterin-dependent oxidoreductase [Microbacterium sp. SLBN-146]|uniref:molybdopterin-dependent oxidoreductase n=1 Tax=Microbacterium sp. SLBN-146 TaxID=2768457 RepID=UPI00114DF85F|nr:molybdopterin-dependent oxidoreductase [Microbacterium sp. SLBN-146]TQJ30111.1 DMSO/TMAO reductase YedYZ molybdopterin-dependent catalytic subunit [Microbacterium sp. SLBN-146]
MDTAPERRPGWTPLGWLAGVSAVVFGAGIGELVARFISPESSPIAAIGGGLIDLAPSWAKDAAIALFGTADKIALIVGIALVLLVVAAIAGQLELRRPPWGVVIVAGLGVIGVGAALLRADDPASAWIPAALAGAASVFGLRLLTPLARAESPARSRAAVPEPALVGAGGSSSPMVDDDNPDRDENRAAAGAAASSRRTFLLWSAGAIVVGVGAALVGGVRTAATVAVESVRSALRLPAAAVTAPPIPAGAELDIPGLAPVITPNSSFYRIDTALIVPEIDPADWALRVHGMVENEFFLSWDELLALPLEESVTTLACVSNPVGGDLIGNAVWLGYPLREILARAKPLPDADMVLSGSRDGFTASTPIEALTDDRNAILAVGMNGEPLPLAHGFPVRMVVPGLYGYVSATKWVTSLEVTRFDKVTAYWTDRGWSERGPVKLQSRIDVPRDRQGLSAGDTVIAGVAWQQHVGVAGVEVQIDDGPWQRAELATPISDDTWVQWSLPWTAEPGDHVLRCRALSSDGETQIADRAGVVPDGATGWHERFVQVFEQ